MLISMIVHVAQRSRCTKEVQIKHIGSPDIIITRLYRHKCHSKPEILIFFFYHSLLSLQLTKASNFFIT